MAKQQFGYVKKRKAMNRIHETQWVLTYQCGLNAASEYCSLGSHAQNEANLEQKIQAIEIFEKIGVSNIKLLGGNPTDLPEIDEIIVALNESTISFVVTDNAMNGPKILAIAKKIVFKKNSGFFFSLDFLDENLTNSIGGCSVVKTKAAIKLIPKLVDLVPLLGVNTVVHAKNLDELPKILAWITKLGGYMNLCLLIWSKWDKFLYRTADREFALRPEHRPKVEQIMAILLEMKRHGYHLACSEKYIVSLAKVCCRDDCFGWNCGHLSNCPLLRVNSDLSLMICSDLQGNQVKNFKLDDLLDPAKYATFQQTWLNDNDRLYCASRHGCYWSNVWRAADNFEEGGSFVK